MQDVQLLNVEHDEQPVVQLEDYVPEPELELELELELQEPKLNV